MHNVGAGDEEDSIKEDEVRSFRRCKVETEISCPKLAAAKQVQSRLLLNDARTLGNPYHFGLSEWFCSNIAALAEIPCGKPADFGEPSRTQESVKFAIRAATNGLSISAPCRSVVLGIDYKFRGQAKSRSLISIGLHSSMAVNENFMIQSCNMICCTSRPLVEENGCTATVCSQGRRQSLPLTAHTIVKSVVNRSCHPSLSLIIESQAGGFDG